MKQKFALDDAAGRPVKGHGSFVGAIGNGKQLFHAALTGCLPEMQKQRRRYATPPILRSDVDAVEKEHGVPVKPLQFVGVSKAGGHISHLGYD